MIAYVYGSTLLRVKAAGVQACPVTLQYVGVAEREGRYTRGRLTLEVT